jgi:hypothetical protein
MSRISNGDLLTVEGHLGLVTVVVGQPTETAGDPAEGLIA